MQHLLQPNDWSCLATCAAMLADTQPKDVFDFLGHDGSEQVGEHRRGFHIQEITDYLIYESFLPVWIQASAWTIWEDGTEYHVPFDEVGRITRYMERTGGILVGSPVNEPKSFHAVVWNIHEMVCFDPRGPRISPSDFSIDGFLYAQ